jgi:hypothetical protein
LVFFGSGDVKAHIKSEKVTLGENETIEMELFDVTN